MNARVEDYFIQISYLQPNIMKLLAQVTLCKYQEGNDMDMTPDINNNNNSYMTSPWGPAWQAWSSHESAGASLHMQLNSLSHYRFHIYATMPRTFIYQFEP